MDEGVITILFFGADSKSISFINKINQLKLKITITFIKNK